MDTADSWGLFWGTVVGIIAGTLVQYLTQCLFEKLRAKTLIQNFKKELAYDVGVIANLLTEAGRLRTAIGGGSLAAYNGFFKYTDVFFVMGNKALSEGLLYHAIDQTHLLSLQKAATFFSGSSENWTNNEIAKYKAGGAGSPANFVNYIEDEMRRHLAVLQEIIRALSS